MVPFCPQLRAVEVLDVLSEAAVRGGSQPGTFAFDFPALDGSSHGETQGFSMGFSMGFQPLEERPDYGYLRQLLRDAFAKEGDLPWFLVLASGTWKRMTFHKQDTHTHIIYYIHTLFVCIM